MPTGLETLPLQLFVDRGGEPRPTAIHLERPPASLSPSVVGSAWTEWVQPIITVSASARARAISATSSRSASRSNLPPAARNWSARAVSTTSLLVSAEMQIAALGADRLGDLADEGDDVVIRRLLDLGDPLHVDAGARLERRQRIAWDLTAGRLGADDRQLHRSMASNRAASAQMAPISGRV